MAEIVRRRKADVGGGGGSKRRAIRHGLLRLQGRRAMLEFMDEGLQTFVESGKQQSTSRRRRRNR